MSIFDVWRHNLDEAFEMIANLEDEYHYVAIDTEFPGIVLNPKTPEHRRSLPQSQMNYLQLRENVNSLKIIQLGLSFSNEAGEKPEMHTLQFNFEFNLWQDLCAPDAINLLKHAGIEFERHVAEGVKVQNFGERLMSSGLVLNDRIRWISFHGMYDFGYLLQLLTNQGLPEIPQEFFASLQLYFPRLTDLKYCLRSDFRGGLQALAQSLGAERQGSQHQGGSDALLTTDTFFKLEESKKESAFDNCLFGLNSEDAFWFEPSTWDTQRYDFSMPPVPESMWHYQGAGGVHVEIDGAYGNTITSHADGVVQQHSLNTSGGVDPQNEHRQEEVLDVNGTLGTHACVVIKNNSTHGNVNSTLGHSTNTPVPATNLAYPHHHQNNHGVPTTYNSQQHDPYNTQQHSMNSSDAVGGINHDPYNTQQQHTMNSSDAVGGINHDPYNTQQHSMNSSDPVGGINHDPYNTQQQHSMNSSDAVGGINHDPYNTQQHSMNSSENLDMLGDVIQCWKMMHHAQHTQGSMNNDGGNTVMNGGDIMMSNLGHCMQEVFVVSDPHGMGSPLMQEDYGENNNMHAYINIDPRTCTHARVVGACGEEYDQNNMHMPCGIGAVSVGSNGMGGGEVNQSNGLMQPQYEYEYGALTSMSGGGVDEQQHVGNNMYAGGGIGVLGVDEQQQQQQQQMSNNMYAGGGIGVVGVDEQQHLSNNMYAGGPMDIGMSGMEQQPMQHEFTPAYVYGVTGGPGGQVHGHAQAHGQGGVAHGHGHSLGVSQGTHEHGAPVSHAQKNSTYNPVNDMRQCVVEAQFLMNGFNGQLDMCSSELCSTDSGCFKGEAVSSETVSTVDTDRESQPFQDFVGSNGNVEQEAEW